ELALERLRRGHTLERKRPRQLLGRATGGVGLHGFFPAGVGAQDLHRRRCLPLPGVEKRPFLAHVLSSLSRARNLPQRPALASRGRLLYCTSTLAREAACVFHGIDPRSPIPLYAQIAERVRLAIATGALGSAALLPSVRQLAAELRVNPATVIQAYRELESQGYVEIRHGAGTFVRELAPGRRAKERSKHDVRLVRRLIAEARRNGVSMAELQQAIETEIGVRAS